jgi:hypothetical protein
MARMTAALLVSAALLGQAGPAAAQPAPEPSPAPRVEFGAGGGWFYSGGTMPFTDGLIQARASVRVSRRWSIEGLIDVQPPSDSSFYGFYRVQAKWRSSRAGAQPFVAVGGAGEMLWYRWPAYTYTDGAGKTWSWAAVRGFDVGAPIYPTATFGVEVPVASHLAIRAELGTAFGINDYGISMAFLPAVSVCVPIGRYRTGH